MEITSGMSSHSLPHPVCLSLLLRVRSRKHNECPVLPHLSPRPLLHAHTNHGQGLETDVEIDQQENTRSRIPESHLREKCEAGCELRAIHASN